MVSLAESRRPGTPKRAVFEACDEHYRRTGRPPEGDEVRDAMVARGFNPNSVRSWISQWRTEWRDRRGQPAGTRGDRDASGPDRREPGSVGRTKLQIAGDGRLLIPQGLRDAMALDPSGAVTAEVVDGELRVVSPRAAIRRIQRIAQKYKKPGQNVVEEFLAERRAMWGEE